MAQGSINIDGKEYVLGQDGRFLDLDGKLCGFVGSEIVKGSGLTHRGDNLVDMLAAALTQTKPVGAKASGIRPPQGTHLAMPVIIAGTGMIIRAGYEYIRKRQAEGEADRAEEAAKEMQKRLEEARRRHGVK